MVEFDLKHRRRIVLSGFAIGVLIGELLVVAATGIFLPNGNVNSIVFGGEYLGYFLGYACLAFVIYALIRFRKSAQNISATDARNVGLVAGTGVGYIVTYLIVILKLYLIIRG